MRRTKNKKTVAINPNILKHAGAYARMHGFSTERYIELAILAYNPTLELEAFKIGATTATLLLHENYTDSKLKTLE